MRKPLTVKIVRVAAQTIGLIRGDVLALLRCISTIRAAGKGGQS